MFGGQELSITCSVAGRALGLVAAVPIRPREALKADAVYHCLRHLHRRIEFACERKARGQRTGFLPAVHLYLRREAPYQVDECRSSLVRFTTFDDRFIILAPDAVAITIEPQPENREGFPVEFLDEDQDARRSKRLGTNSDPGC